MRYSLQRHLCYWCHRRLSRTMHDTSIMATRDATRKTDAITARTDNPGLYSAPHRERRAPQIHVIRTRSLCDIEVTLPDGTSTQALPDLQEPRAGAWRRSRCPLRRISSFHPPQPQPRPQPQAHSRFAISRALPKGFCVDANSSPRWRRRQTRSPRSEREARTADRTQGRLPRLNANSLYLPVQGANARTGGTARGRSGGRSRGRVHAPSRVPFCSVIFFLPSMRSIAI
ncbi:uncharacterized protein C8Q71DRAFT_477306 [Rhodofomes roseus]|uniref:Uncharacterized protein n=1 Tax=Rhodofomes roseus TaxID=34475 RepID=A0ABQ8KP50_9APHY|nr:uncharacterized protein C8Q71DRAFT_477306 [Rhodofomes roseus]KAH9840101.1 hypothetical protein C8Q71DRAFT_477306 [Rhodofomes roseus]